MLTISIREYCEQFVREGFGGSEENAEPGKSADLSPSEGGFIDIGRGQFGKFGKIACFPGQAEYFREHPHALVAVILVPIASGPVSGRIAEFDNVGVRV